MSQHYKLIAVDSDEEFTLDKHEIMVGRSSDCDIVITEGYASRKHAMLMVQGGIVSIQDLGSTNGTYVNNQRVKSLSALNDGDVIRFDVCSYHLVSPNSDNTTVVMSRLDPSGQADQQSSVVIHDGFVGGESTAFRQDFPLPASWGVDERKAYQSQKGAERYPTAIIDNLVAKGLPPETAPDAVLVVVSGQLESRLIALKKTRDQQRWIIGRDADCPIQFSDSSMSSQHAEISVNANSWTIRDLNSKNGLLLNGNRASESNALESGDRIALGQIELVFRQF